jgi:hypothetical protein
LDRFGKGQPTVGPPFAPRLETDAVLIPLAFGLAGVNLHTWTG